MLSMTTEKRKRFCTHEKTDENVYCVFLPLFTDTYPPSLWITRLGFSTSIQFKKTDYIAKQSSKTDRWWPL